MKKHVMLSSLALMLAVVIEAGAEDDVARGEYLIRVSGCNDCHTDGYMQNNGQIPREQWLLGSRFGWRGPWGTTYAPNLRLSIPAKTETQWVEYARGLKTRPPMPWANLNAMNEADLKAIYRFVTSLGTAGEVMPQALAQGVVPDGPHALFP